MKTYFRCPDCRTRLWAAAELADGAVHCPTCNAHLEVPRPPEKDEPEEPTARELPLNVRSDKEPIEAEMDMTPMIDVTFLLLIFFMVTTTFNLQKTFPVPVPQSDLPSTSATMQELEEDPETITVRVDSHNTYRVICPAFDEEAPSEQELFIKLRAARSTTPEANKLLVIAHGDARHDKVVTAMDAGTAVGMDGIKLMTVEEDAY